MSWTVRFDPSPFIFPDRYLTSARYLILALAFYVYPDDAGNGVGIFSKLIN